jgi:hypothetical protein
MIAELGTITGGATMVRPPSAMTSARRGRKSAALHPVEMLIPEFLLMVVEKDRHVGSHPLERFIDLRKMFLAHLPKFFEMLSQNLPDFFRLLFIEVQFPLQVGKEVTWGIVGHPRRSHAAGALVVDG